MLQRDGPVEVQGRGSRGSVPILPHGTDAAGGVHHLPGGCSLRLGVRGEGADALLQLGCRQRLRGGGHVHGLGRTLRGPRVEDHDAQLGPGRQVPRVPRARVRHPEKGPIPNRRVPDGRRPGQPVLVGRAERHEAVVVNDRSRDRLEFVTVVHAAPFRSPRV